MTARLPALLLALALLLTGCSSGGEEARGGARPGTSPAPAPRQPTVGERAARAMSLRDLAGQVIVTQWSGTSSPAPLVRRLHLGGVIAFSENVSSTDQVRRVNRSVARAVAPRGWPAFIGVDQEGGLVDRVGAPSTDFPAFMATGAARDDRLTERAARASAAEMRGLGFDVVFAPDADVTVGDRDPAIGSRSAGGRPAEVARQVVAATRGIQAAGVLPVVKHFPGHGSLTADSHLALPVQDRSMARVRRTDLVPFTAAIAARAPALLVGHIAVRALDPGVPASVSRRVTTGLLRRDLGYRGLVVTDSLEMAGVQRQAPGAVAAVRALRAGADVLLMPPDPRAARDAIVRAVRSGRVPRARLEDAAARMIDTLRALRPSAGAAPGSGRGAAAALAREAATSVAGPCRGRLVGDRVRLVGPAADVAAVEERLRARGVSVLHDTTRRVRAGSRTVVTGHRTEVVTVRRKVKGPGGKVRVRTVKQRRRVPVTRKVPVYRTVVVRADAPTLALVGPGGGAEPADVTVALDRPGVLGRVSSRVELATYGDEPVVLDNLVQVLLGDHPAPGRLPLDVPGAARAGC